MAWVRPSSWGISARSAVVSATVVLVALMLVGAGVAAALYGALLDDIDDAAEARVRAVAAALRNANPGELDKALLATDNRLVAVQILRSDGTVVRRTGIAPPKPLMPIDELTSLNASTPQQVPVQTDMRITAQRVDSPGGEYVVLVGEGREIVESTMKTVATTLAVIAPIVTAVSAVVTYRLVRRSMRSVDEIRSRVADISTSDLTERVPVPANSDEIAALAVTMNEMLARIEAGHAAQRRFVGDASHELRSPLTTIISALEVAAAHPEVLDRGLAATTLIPEAHRMQALVEDLLLLARADERGLVERLEDIDLDHLAAGQAVRLQSDTTLKVCTDLTPTRMVGDTGALSRVLRNLIDNAARHATSRVEIGVFSLDGQAVIRVGDDGPGIPEGDRQRVFDRFVRLDPGRSRSAGGTGLGLPIVAEIVAAHKGKVSIFDRRDGGTEVVVQLPLAYSPDSRR